MTYRILVYLFLAFITLSCATHFGTVQGTQITPTKKGVVYEEKVYGYASCEYVFFIGGMGKQGLADEAMSNLQKSVKLEDGEYLDNFTVNHKKLYLAPLYIRHEVLVSADKIRSMDSFPVRYDSAYLEQIAFSQHLELPFSRNEKVYFYKQSNSDVPIAKIVVHPGIDDSKTLKSGDYGGIEVNSSDNSRLFKRNATKSLHSFLGFNEGDSITYQPSFKSAEEYISGKMLGSNGSHILLKHGDATDVVHKERIIMENVLSRNDIRLDRIMLDLFKSTGPNEPVLFKDGERAVKSGKLQGIHSSLAEVEVENEGIVEVPISQLYTLRNWLIVNTHKYSFQKFYKNNTVFCYDDPYSEPIKVRIVGFRYYNVLVVLENGELKEVPFGKLSLK